MVKPTAMTKPLFIIILVLTLCGQSCQKWTQNLEAVGLLMVTPSLEAANGWNSELSAIAPDDFLAEESSSLFVGLFEVDGYTPTDPTVAATGARVELSNHNQSIEFCETIPEISGEFVHPPSNDSLNSTTENANNNSDSIKLTQECPSATWVYEYATKHTLAINWNEKAYELFFTTAAEAPSPNYQWTPDFQKETSLLASGLLHHPLNTALTLSWPAAETSAEHLPHLSISRLIYSGDTSNPSEFLDPQNWSTDPSNPIYEFPERTTQSLLYFLVSAEKTEKSIEASYFSKAGLYNLTVHDLNLSTNSSANLSLGSGSLSGPGINTLIWVH